jgi:TrmH family RNA methyltransferase
MPNISKNKAKQLLALKKKKIRDEKQEFLAEGEKIVDELIHSKYQIISIFATKEWIINHHTKVETIEIEEDDLKQLSSLTTPNQVIAVVKIPKEVFNLNEIKNELSLVLEDIQDPGNMGTIIRTADWFGIKNIICSENTVELYNPKVIQATMGAFLRVKVTYTNLHKFFEENQKNIKLPVFGTLLKGNNIYETNLSKSGLIIMGNESKGVSSALMPFINEKITIPSYSLNKDKTESLNVSIATAVICAEFRRRLAV